MTNTFADFLAESKSSKTVKLPSNKHILKPLEEYYQNRIIKEIVSYISQFSRDKFSYNVVKIDSDLQYIRQNYLDVYIELSTEFKPFLLKSGDISKTGAFKKIKEKNVTRVHGIGEMTFSIISDFKSSTNAFFIIEGTCQITEVNI